MDADLLERARTLLDRGARRSTAAVWAFLVIAVLGLVGAIFKDRYPAPLKAHADALFYGYAGLALVLAAGALVAERRRQRRLAAAEDVLERLRIWCEPRGPWPALFVGIGLTGLVVYLLGGHPLVFLFPIAAVGGYRAQLHSPPQLEQEVGEPIERLAERLTGGGAGGAD